LIGDWYVLARSESVFEETGQCTMKRFHTSPEKPLETLQLLTTEQHVDRSTGKMMPRTEGIDGRLRNRNMSSNDAEYEFKFD
jgi:hypothetical protein